MARLLQLSLPRLQSGQNTPLAGAGWRLLVVYKASCPTCRVLLPLLARFFDLSAGKADLALVSQDSAADSAGLVSELGLAMPVFLDAPDFQLSKALGCVSVPMLVELSGGRLVAVTEGLNKIELGAMFGRFGDSRQVTAAARTVLADPSLPEHKPG